VRRSSGDDEYHRAYPKGTSTLTGAENIVVMYLALKRAGRPDLLLVQARGDHDFSVRQNEKLPSSWTQLCVR
jgi:hypothetical protein